MVEGIQYGGGITSVSERYSVQMCHTPSVWRTHIISMVEGMQCGPVTSSILRSVCGIRLPKLLRG